VYGEIYKKFLSAGNIGYPITDEAPAVDIAGKTCRFNNFYGGAAIYWTAEDGAHLIYGAIYQKWISVGGVKSKIGYPVTDEATAPDNKCRFNNFKYLAGAVYWTQEDGAHVIYGKICEKWISMGGVQSSIGYPITDETSSGNNGGRYNDFIGGTIYWSPATGAHEHVELLPDQLFFDWKSITFPDGIAVGGWSNVTLFKNGNAHLDIHMHASGPVPYDYSIAWAIRDADNQVYTLGHGGTVGPNLDPFPGGKPDDNFDDTRNNAAIAVN